MHGEWFLAPGGGRMLHPAIEKREEVDVLATARTFRPTKQQLAIVAALVAAAIATRFSAFGNPIYDIDDQFYLVVGQSILHGQLPYVDIWDRKPLGLFLIYASIAALGGSGVAQYQIVAGLFAVATAFIIQRIASRLSGPLGSTLAAIVYLVMLPLFGGQGGQSPVFYNLFITGAALLAVRSIEQGLDNRFHRRAFAAMLLSGAALTVKQVSFVEGSFIGLTFLAIAYRDGMTRPKLMRLAAAMVALALLPTALCLIAYAATGHANAFFYANFVSIFEKGSQGLEAKLAGAAYLLIFMAPLFIFALWGARLRSQSQTPPLQIRAFVIGWMVAAVLGIMVVPNFYDHYDLPLIAPLSVSASTVLARPLGPVFAGVLLIYSNANGDLTAVARNQDSKHAFARMVEAVDANLKGGCLFVDSGPSLLYSATPACRLTAYLFGEHLKLRVERAAVGIDTRMELRRILGLQPAVIVTRDPSKADDDPVNSELLASELQSHYRLVQTEAVHERIGNRQYKIWARRGSGSAN